MGQLLDPLIGPDDAEEERTKFLELAKTEKVIAMDNPYFPGTKILAIASEVLAGKVAGARGTSEERITHLKTGVELEDAMPYMEPPYWYYPVRQSLGAALLKNGKAVEAEAASLPQPDVQGRVVVRWGD